MSRIFTAEMISNMRNWYKDSTAQDLTTTVNDRYGMELTVGQIKSACSRYKVLCGRTGQFHKGMTPINKGVYSRRSKPTEFKKGHTPSGTLPTGSMRYCAKDDIWMVKTPSGKWKSYQRALWEETNGKLTNSEIVVIIDRSQPITIDNIAMVTRAESVKLNKMQFSSKPPEVRRSLIAIVRLEVKARNK